MKILFFSDVTPCSLAEVHYVTENPATPIVNVDELLRNAPRHHVQNLQFE